MSWSTKRHLWRDGMNSLVTEIQEARASAVGVSDGAYLHWPELDEDLTVVGLLAGRHSGERVLSP